jgi:hypothetical protein
VLLLDNYSTLRLLDVEIMARRVAAMPVKQCKSSQIVVSHPIAPWPLIIAWAGLALSLTYLFFIALGGLNLG